MVLAGQAKVPGGVCGAGWLRRVTGGGVLGGGCVEGDCVAEGFEFGDQAFGLGCRVAALGVVVLAEFVVGLAGGHDVPDDHEHGVGDDDDRFLFGGRVAVATPFHDVPVVERFEVAAVPYGRPGGFDQDRLEVLVAFAAFAAAAFTG